MGLEETEKDGMFPKDVDYALMGHIKDGYQFNSKSPISVEDPCYIKDPSLQDKVHCLVSVVPANSISRTEKGHISKMEMARDKANFLGIPHVVIMTKVEDNVCPLVKKDLANIYCRRAIKDKMQNCSDILGPMKCIFPVSNYHEEVETNSPKDVLILMALLQIVKFARDYVNLK